MKKAGVEFKVVKREGKMSKYTQKVIMESFLELLKNKPFDKITVTDVIEKADINRNTFYYYFENIYDLIDQIFVQEEKRFRNESHENSTFYDEYSKAAAIILNNRNAIINIYKSKSQDVLKQYIEKTAKLVVEYFVRKAAEKNNVPEDGIAYVTFFYSYAITGNTMRWINDGMPEYREELLKTMSRSFEGTIDNMLKSYIE